MPKSFPMTLELICAVRLGVLGEWVQTTDPEFGLIIVGTDFLRHSTTVIDTTPVTSCFVEF